MGFDKTQTIKATEKSFPMVQEGMQKYSPMKDTC